MRRLSAAFIFLFFSVASPPATAQNLDLIIRNGRVLDGSGGPWFRADIGIADGRIKEIGNLSGRTAAKTIDAEDKIVAPGFIDMMGGSSVPLLLDPVAAESKLRQGITTMMAGEGDSDAPQKERTTSTSGSASSPVDWRTFAEFFSKLESRGIALNVVENVGAAQVRRIVIGDEDKKPTPEQMTQMKALVEQAMKDGAVGISTALIYPPGIYASTDELVELSKVAAQYGGVYFSHMRNESNGVLEAIREAVHIGKTANIPVHIYHLKAAGQENWPLMADAIALIQDARDRGLDVTADFYPYIRNGIGLGSFIHPRHFARGADAFLPTLSDRALRAQLRKEIETTKDWENWYRHVGSNWDNVLISRVGPKTDPAFVGLSVQQVAARRKIDAWTAFFDLVQEDGIDVNPKSMNEDQKRLALRAPFIMIDTDAEPMNPAKVASAHPRAFGTFPRILAKYVRYEKVIPVEEAIRKFTSLPANRLGLFDRGRLALGMAADIVVFDPAKVQDVATFTKPLEYSDGMDYVIVNGKPVIDAGRATGDLPGRVLRHNH
jgi:N-acyl-D-amino-acid deacylase